MTTTTEEQKGPAGFAAGRLGRGAAWAFGVFGILVAVASLGYLLANLDRGLDLTDESFYLLWADQPTAYRVSQTLFGFVLSPVYHLLGMQPAALRCFGAVIGAASATLLMWTVLLLSSKDGRRSDRWLATLALMACAAAGSIGYYAWWLPTPSYDWMPLPAAFLLATALLLLSAGRYEKLSALLTGLAGVLAFAGKPTAGATFLCLYMVGAPLAAGLGRRTLRHVALSGLACAAWIALAMIFIVDPRLAFEQLEGYFKFFGAAPASGGLLSHWGGVTGYYAALLCAGIAIYFPRLAKRWLGGLTLLAAMVAAYQVRHDVYHVAQGMLIGAASLAAIANCLAWRTREPDPHMVAVLGLTQVLPWLIAFGSGSVLGEHTSFYVALPAVGAMSIAVLCFDRTDWRPLAGGAAVALSAVVALLAANANPYRLSPGLLRQDQPVAVAGGTLRVDAPTAAFIAKLRQDAAVAGFRQGTPILDFSGDSPGIALLLGGQPPVFPWLVGGYGFSNNFAAMIVAAMTPAERQSAWIVRSDGPRPFALNFMRTLGFDLETGYTVVSQLRHPLSGHAVTLYAPRGRGSSGG